MRRKRVYVIAGAVMIIAAVAMTTIYMSQQKTEKQFAKQESTEKEQVASEEEIARQATEEAAQKVDSIIEPEPKTIEDIAKELGETAQDGQNLAEADIADTGSDDKDAKTKNTETEDTEDSPAQAASAAVSGGSSAQFSADSNLNWPLQGDVILNFSMDKTVYFATLDQYKYNPAVIISGNVNDRVNHVADGTVTDVSTNETTGCTVTVDLGGGYEAVYGQLKSLTCKVGDTVKSGTAVGYVSEPTKYYSVEGANLYFELKKDGEPVDPVSFFQ